MLNKGTYFFPRKGKEDFELDLSRFPVIEMKDGSRIVFTDKTHAPVPDPDLLRSLWEHVDVIQITKDTSVDTILSAVFRETPKKITEAEISFSDNGMEVSVTAKWIKTSPPEEDGSVRHTCISVIEDMSQKTSDAIVRYLDQHLVTIKDIFETEVGIEQPGSSTASSTPFVLPDVITLTPIYRKTFVRGLMEALGSQYSTDITITFPYAGIQVQAVSNLVSTDGGKEFLIDFGDLYGDAVTEIQKTGLSVVKINPDDDMKTLITRLLVAMDAPYISNPVFYAAKRPADFNTKLKIEGFLITPKKGSRVLISTIPLHNRVLQFFNEDNVKVVLAGAPE